MTIICVIANILNNTKGYIMKKLIRIPFSGFYETHHGNSMDNELEGTLSEYEGKATADEIEQLQSYWYEINWGDYFKQYAENYAYCFSEIFDVKLDFQFLESPKFYNFETDKIFCNIEFSEIERIYKESDKKVFAEIAAKQLTSRSGFISFYNPGVETWGDLKDYDHNQLYILLQAYCHSKEGKNWQEQIEYIDDPSLYELVYRCDLGAYNTYVNFLYEKYEAK